MRRKYNPDTFPDRFWSKVDRSSLDGARCLRGELTVWLLSFGMAPFRTDCLFAMSATWVPVAETMAT